MLSLPSRLWSLPLTVLALALTGCITHIKSDVTQNPPPAEKFSAFSRFELAAITLPPPYAGQAPNERALVKIQQNVSFKMTPQLEAWNASGAPPSPARTLLIQPSIAEIKFISVGSRVMAGALAGSSAVILRARITDKETGAVIATPEFYARASAMGGNWSLGATDNMMLVRIADRLTDYLKANYTAAVGGPSGAEPPKK
jgi:hypothetical protein